MSNLERWGAGDVKRGVPKSEGEGIAKWLEKAKSLPLLSELIDFIGTDAKRNIDWRVREEEERLFSNQDDDEKPLETVEAADFDDPNNEEIYPFGSFGDLMALYPEPEQLENEIKTVRLKAERMMTELGLAQNSVKIRPEAILWVLVKGKDITAREKAVVIITLNFSNPESHISAQSLSTDDHAIEIQYEHWGKIFTLVNELKARGTSISWEAVALADASAPIPYDISEQLTPHGHLYSGNEIFTDGHKVADPKSVERRGSSLSGFYNKESGVVNEGTYIIVGSKTSRDNYEDKANLDRVILREGADLDKQAENLRHGLGWF